MNSKAFPSEIRSILAFHGFELPDRIMNWGVEVKNERTNLIFVITIRENKFAVSQSYILTFKRINGIIVSEVSK